MKMYIKQEALSFRPRFHVYDSSQNELYYVEGRGLIGREITVYKEGRPAALITNELFSWVATYYIDIDDQPQITLKKRFKMFSHEFDITPLNWKIYGDFMSHEFEINDMYGNNIATISKEWFTWGDSYCIDADDQYELEVLCLLICIDCILASEAASSSAATSN